VIDALVGPDGNARWDVPQRARHGRNDDVVEDWNDFITRDDQYRAALLVRCFHQPDFGLGYHGSASVIAMALAIASSSSSGVWGCSRYDAAMEAPARARRTDSARSWTPRRMTADRLSAMPLSTSSSINASSSSVNRVGTGVVIRPSIRAVEHVGAAPGHQSLRTLSRRVSWSDSMAAINRSVSVRFSCTSRTSQ
jgi:hypothetical protein